MARRLAMLALVLAAVTVGCDRIQDLTRLENNRTRITGNWHRVVMSLPGDDDYAFSNEVIYRNEVECGSYIFETNTLLEVTLDGTTTQYHVEFTDDETMTWSRDTPAGRQVAVTWKR
jgi:hypothetical protein